MKAIRCIALVVAFLLVGIALMVPVVLCGALYLFLLPFNFLINEKV